MPQYVKVSVDVYVATDWSPNNVGKMVDNWLGDTISEMGLVYTLIEHQVTNAESIDFEDLPAGMQEDITELDQELDRLEADDDDDDLNP